MASERPSQNKTRQTHTDLVSLAGGGVRLVQAGVSSPSPGRAHQRTLGRLLTMLDRYVTAHDLGEVYPGPFDVVLEGTHPGTVVRPDILFVFKDRLNIVTRENVQGPPDLVVEVLCASSAHEDRVYKLKLYTEFGVRQYWLVDAEAHTLRVFDLMGDTPRLATMCVDDDVFCPRVFPGLEIPLGDIWYPVCQETG